MIVDIKNTSKSQILCKGTLATPLSHLWPYIEAQHLRWFVGGRPSDPRRRYGPLTSAVNTPHIPCKLLAPELLRLI